MTRTPLPWLGITVGVAALCLCVNFRAPTGVCPALPRVSSRRRPTFGSSSTYRMVAIWRGGAGEGPAPGKGDRASMQASCTRGRMSLTRQN